jgi:hypothetical protein
MMQINAPEIGGNVPVMCYQTSRRHAPWREVVNGGNTKKWIRGSEGTFVY